MKICTAPQEKKNINLLLVLGLVLIGLCLFVYLLLLNLAQIHVQGTCGAVRKEPYVYLQLQRYIVGVLF